MTKKKTVEVYEFDELSSSAKAKVLEEFRYTSVENTYWYEFIIEDWKDKLSEMGFEDVEIEFSGFGSQGDGASFVTKNIDTDTYIKSMYSKGHKMMRLVGKSEDFEISLTRNSHQYSYENTVSVDYYYEGDGEKEDALVRELADEIEGHARELMKEIYKNLEEHYESETSDEAVSEIIELNDYIFLKDGRMFSE